MGPNDDRADADRAPLDQLVALFERGAGRQTTSVRCDRCGNAEIGSVRLIQLAGRVWLVYGTTREPVDTADVVARRMKRGWRPSALEAYVLHRAGVRLDDGLALEAPARRAKRRALHVEVLTTREGRSAFIEAHCRRHGRFAIYWRYLTDMPRRGVQIVRVNEADQIMRHPRAEPT